MADSTGNGDTEQRIRELIRERVRAVSESEQDDTKRRQNVQELADLLALPPETVLFMMWTVEDLLEAAEERKQDG